MDVPSGRPPAKGGAAWRRRQPRLRSWWRHEQQSVAAALATFTHHSAPRGQRTARARGGRELKYGRAPEDAPPPGGRCGVLRDGHRGGPRVRTCRRAASTADGGAAAGGFEAARWHRLRAGALIHRAAGGQEVETDLHVFLKMVKDWEEAKEQEKGKAVARKVTVQAIPEVQGGASSRAAPPQGRMGGGKVPRVIPPKGISERIMQQIVDVPVHGPPQARTSERIQEQTAVPGLQSIPQERTSKRIVEQNVDVSELQVIPQKRISKRIVEQIADDPVQQVIPQKRISQRIVKQSVDDPVPQIIPQKRISERIVKQNVDEFMQVIPQERNSERIQGHVYEGMHF